jgi:hypothetical protein
MGSQAQSCDAEFLSQPWQQRVNRDDPESMAMSGPAGSGQSAAAGATLVTAQSGMSALAGRRSCPDGEIDAIGQERPPALQNDWRHGQTCGPSAIGC